MILVPLPYKLYGVFRHTFCMENLLYKSKSEQGVANLYFDFHIQNLSVAVPVASGPPV